MRRESNERNRGPRAHLRVEERARREGYMTQLSLAVGIVVGSVGHTGCIGRKNKETLKAGDQGQKERETERVVEKRWQKEETKGDRV